MPIIGHAMPACIRVPLEHPGILELAQEIGVPHSWISGAVDWKVSPPTESTTALAHRLAELPPEKARDVLDLLPFLNLGSELESFIGLSLGNPGAWNAYTDQLFLNGCWYLRMLGLLQPGFRKLTSKQKTDLLEKVKSLYFKAPKDLPTPAKDSGFFPQEKGVRYRAPRRAMGAMIKALLDMQSRFGEAENQGEPVIKAYDAYLDEMNFTHAQSGKPKNFSAAEIHETAQQFQISLRALASRSRQPNQDFKLIIFGSFPNGVAGLDSDIDLLCSPDHLGRARKVFSAVVEARNQSFRKKSLLHVKEMISLRSRNEDLLDPNSVAIEITPDSIHLLAYPTSLQSLPNGTQYARAEPKRYELDSAPGLARQAEPSKVRESGLTRVRTWMTNLLKPRAH